MIETIITYETTSKELFELAKLFEEKENNIQLENNTSVKTVTVAPYVYIDFVLDQDKI